MSDYLLDSPIEQAFIDAWDDHIPLEPQYSISNYLVDFAHVPTKTAIELDGFATHSSTEDIAKDRKRQRDLQRLGWEVIRFGGKEIHENVHACVAEVQELLYRRAQFLGYDSIPEPEPEPVIPPAPQLALTHRRSASPVVGWSDFWGGWTIQVRKIDDEVICSLWFAQLLSQGCDEVYWVRESIGWSEREAETTDKYLAPLALSEELHYDTIYRRAWCEQCSCWSKFMLDRRNPVSVAWRCVQCTHGAQVRIPVHELPIDGRGNATLMRHALRLWESKLSSEQRDQVRYYVGSIRGYRPGTYLCKLLAGIAVAQLAPGKLIKTSEMSEFFWEKVPWIREQISRPQWDRLMSTGLTVWITHGWIEKQSRGVYRRLVAPVRQERRVS